MKIQF